MSRAIESKKRIYKMIEQYPGIHFRELTRTLNMQVGLLDYHLRKMEKDGLIIAKIDGKYKRYYASTTHSPKERYLLGILRQTIPRAIVITLLQHQHLTTTELATKLAYSQQIISYYLKKLEIYKIVKSKKENNKTVYYITIPEFIATVLIKYKQSFVDKLVTAFIEFWLKDK